MNEYVIVFQIYFSKIEQIIKLKSYEEIAIALQEQVPTVGGSQKL